MGVGRIGRRIVFSDKDAKSDTSILIMRRHALAAAYYTYSLAQTIGHSIGFMSSSSLRVLIFHDIATRDQGRFISFINWLSRNRNIVTPEQFTSMIQGLSRIQGHNLLLTFDDGFQSNRIIAENVLAPLDIKAIFFIPTGFIDCTSEVEKQDYIREQIKDFEFRDAAEPMSWEDIKWLVDNNHEIGAHTVSHAKLSEINDPEQLKSEIVRSGDDLESRLGRSIRYFAYPFGDIGSISEDALSIIGTHYRFCFSGIRGINSSHTYPLALRRESINIRDTIHYNKFVVSGGLSFYYRSRRSEIDRMIEQV